MWYFNNKIYNELDETYIGFVYKITDLKKEKFYIGKKLFFFSKTKIIKKKKKRYKEESDWRTYCGSNDELQQEFLNRNHVEFRKDIIRLCKTKGEMSYYESKMIFEEDALLSDDYYNKWVSVRLNANTLKKIKKEDLR